jgi:DNA-binding transcriptional MerR regulator
MSGMEWTLEELVQRVADALGASGVRAPNGRVTEVPDARMIRWYASTGLVDRPHAMRGRVALYGRRHLLQLVAIKRRQGEGRSLAQIQAELAGATDDQLAAVAGLSVEPAPTRDRFWAERPALPPAEIPRRPGVRPFPPIPQPVPPESHPAKVLPGLPLSKAAGRLSGVNLGGAVLLLPASPDDATLAEIAAAAR